MTRRPPSTYDGFEDSSSSGILVAEQPKATDEAKERIALDEVIAIFRPDYPPMEVVKLVWDNPDKLDILAMRARLHTMAQALKAKPLNDALDAMMVAVDDALLQLETSPAGLTLAQATVLKAAAVKLRHLLTTRA